jgi:hypothetical protein
MTTTQKRIVISPEGIASYPFLRKPRVTTNDDGVVTGEKYSMAVIFPEGTDLKVMKTMALATLKERHGEETGKLMKAGKLHWPFRETTSEEEAKGYPKGSTFINVSNSQRPGVVNTVPDSKNEGKPTLIDAGEIYAGCVVKVSLNCYYFDKAGKKKGVSFGLRNVQFIRDGTRIDGTMKAQDEFEADPDAVATLGDLDGDTEDPNEDSLADLLR